MGGDAKVGSLDGTEDCKRWNGVNGEIISGMAEWQQRYPNATFREIEGEIDKRLAVLRAKMISDAAISSTQKAGEAVCPKCGARLEGKGEKKCRLSMCGGQEVELEREDGICTGYGQGIFPPG